MINHLICKLIDNYDYSTKKNAVLNVKMLAPLSGDLKMISKDFFAEIVINLLFPGRKRNLSLGKYRGLKNG